MIERTEQEKLAALPVEIQIGGRTFEVRPLPFRPLLEWQRKREAVRQKIRRMEAVQDDGEGSEFSDAVSYLSSGVTGDLSDLVIDFFRHSVSEDEISAMNEFADANGQAYAEQIVKVFDELDTWVNPLKPLLAEAAERMVAGAMMTMAEVVESQTSTIKAESDPQEPMTGNGLQDS